MLIHQGLLSCYSIGLARPQKSEYNKRKRAKREGASYPSKDNHIHNYHLLYPSISHHHKS